LFLFFIFVWFVLLVCLEPFMLPWFGPAVYIVVLNNSFCLSHGSDFIPSLSIFESPSLYDKKGYYRIRNENRTQLTKRKE
jgi:hypothetical protein